MKHVYRKTFKISYNNNVFQVLVRDDKNVGFLKITYDDNNNIKYVYPSAFEFLHLRSLLEKDNLIKF